MTFGGARNGLWQNVENGETSASRSLFPDADGILNMMPYRKMTTIAASLEVKALIIERQLSISSSRIKEATKIPLLLKTCTLRAY